MLRSIIRFFIIIAALVFIPFLWLGDKAWGQNATLGWWYSDFFRYVRTGQSLGAFD